MGATVCRQSSSYRRDGLEDKGLRVNAAKTKIMISSSEARSGFEVGRWSLQKRCR